jgi:hypothetical protein
MGLLYADAARLWKARQAGVSFERTLTIGRQQIYLHERELEQLRRMHAAHGLLLHEYQFGEYAERFWREVIGVRVLDTIDKSDYEGASIIHDLNQPVSPELWEKYDSVVEAGSLEHIFNFPIAIANLMRMVKVGGTVFLTTVANNLCGHGFYQFSPELLYRIFSPENGFDATRVVFLEAGSPSVELVPITRSYEVADAKVVACRVGLLSKTPIMMMLESRKVRQMEPFVTTPQQSDYAAAWQKAQQDEGESRGKFRSSAGSALRGLPPAWQRRIERARMRRRYSFANRSFYRRLP